MNKEFYNGLNLNGNAISGIGTDDALAAGGSIKYESNALYYHNGTSWVAVSDGDAVVKKLQSTDTQDIVFNLTPQEIGTLFDDFYNGYIANKYCVLIVDLQNTISSGFETSVFVINGTSHRIQGGTTLINRTLTFSSASDAVRINIKKVYSGSGSNTITVENTPQEVADVIIGETESSATSVVDSLSNRAVILTETAYNASTNKIATMADVNPPYEILFDYSDLNQTDPQIPVALGTNFSDIETAYNAGKKIKLLMHMGELGDNTNYEIREYDFLYMEAEEGSTLNITVHDSQSQPTTVHPTKAFIFLKVDTFLMLGISQMQVTIYEDPTTHETKIAYNAQSIPSANTFEYSSLTKMDDIDGSRYFDVKYDAMTIIPQSPVGTVTYNGSTWVYGGSTPQSISAGEYLTVSSNFTLSSDTMLLGAPIPAGSYTTSNKFLFNGKGWEITTDAAEGILMVPTMKGADGTNAGASGLVPAPAAGDSTKFLRGDGTWQTAGGGGGGSYTAGDGINITNDEISVVVDNDTIKVNNNGQIYGVDEIHLETINQLDLPMSGLNANTIISRCITAEDTNSTPCVIKLTYTYHQSTNITEHDWLVLKHYKKTVSSTTTTTVLEFFSKTNKITMTGTTVSGQLGGTYSITQEALSEVVMQQPLSTNSDFPILLSCASNTNGTTGYSGNITVNPSNDTLTAPTINGGEIHLSDSDFTADLYPDTIYLADNSDPNDPIELTIDPYGIYSNKFGRISPNTYLVFFNMANFNSPTYSPKRIDDSSSIIGDPIDFDTLQYAYKDGQNISLTIYQDTTVGNDVRRNSIQSLNCSYCGFTNGSASETVSMVTWTNQTTHTTTNVKGYFYFTTNVTYDAGYDGPNTTEVYIYKATDGHTYIYSHSSNALTAGDAINSTDINQGTVSVLYDNATIKLNNSGELFANIDDQTIKKAANTNKLHVNYDNKTIQPDANGALFTNIDNETLLSDSTTGVISVNYDDLSIKKDSGTDALYVNIDSSTIKQTLTGVLHVNFDDATLKQSSSTDALYVNIDNETIVKSNTGVMSVNYDNSSIKKGVSNNKLYVNIDGVTIRQDPSNDNKLYADTTIHLTFLVTGSWGNQMRNWCLYARIHDEMYAYEANWDGSERNSYYNNTDFKKLVEAVFNYYYNEGYNIIVKYGVRSSGTNAQAPKYNYRGTVNSIRFENTGTPYLYLLASQSVQLQLPSGIFPTYCEP